MECVGDLGTARPRVSGERYGKAAVTRGIVLIGRRRYGNIILLIGIRCAIKPCELVLELDSELAKLRAREVLICVHGWILLLLDGRILDARNANRPTSRRSARWGGENPAASAGCEVENLYSGVARMLQAFSTLHCASR
jgi:hypothetical protein